MQSLKGQLVTSESVRKGHPDKVCDYLSDTILDNYLRVDKDSHVACEVLATNGVIVLAGEVNSAFKIDHRRVVQLALRELNYNPDLFRIEDYIHQQSPDINQGVSRSKDKIGAGDQGTMYGYATDETREYLPAPLIVSRKICQGLDELMHQNRLSLGPDGKSQVSIDYDSQGKMKSLDTVVISTQQFTPELYDDLVEDIMTYIIPKAIDGLPIELTTQTKVLVNPTGQFIVGGPEGDTGLTGRKIIVDTYGGIARHGGGAFSGKDATKVDRSAAYMARSLAKHLVRTKICSECIVSISYAIGAPDPVAVYVDTLGTSRVALPDYSIGYIISNNIDMSVSAIIDRFNLKSPIYTQTASYGHFGYDNLPWEQYQSDYEVLNNLINRTEFKENYLV